MVCFRYGFCEWRYLAAGATPSAGLATKDELLASYYPEKYTARYEEPCLVCGPAYLCQLDNPPLEAKQHDS